MATWREQILDAAIDLLRSGGADAVTHRAVDAAAGLPAGSTSNYFRSRNALLEAAVERFADRERANADAIAASLRPTTPAGLAEALAAFAIDATGPHRTLTLARYAILVEMMHDVAVRRATAMSTVELLDRFRGMVGSRRHPPGVTRREAVTDNLVHGPDIAIPLGRPLEPPVRAATVAAQRCYTMRWPMMPKGWPLHPKRGLRQFRLRATDTDWSIGDGPEITAPIGDLLLLIPGRLVVLARLGGPGRPRVPISARRSRSGQEAAKPESVDQPGVRGCRCCVSIVLSGGWAWVCRVRWPELPASSVRVVVARGFAVLVGCSCGGGAVVRW